MSLLLNLGNSITAGTDPYQFYNFRERVLADGATVLSDTQVSDEIKRLRSLGLYSKFSALYTPAVRNTSKLYSIISADGDATVTRGSVKNINSATGNLEQIASNVTPSSFGTGGWGALVEGARTNSIRNNTMAGAVVGTPGTLPTNWITSDGGLTREIIGTGSENGIDYIDIKFSGVATGSPDVRFDTNTGITASNGQNWTQSVWLRLMTSPLPPNSYFNQMIERTSGGSFVVSGSTGAIVTNQLARVIFTRTLAGGGTVERVQPTFGFSLTNGQSYDFTIRIGLPQMEQGGFASSVMKTSSGTVTRNADVITKTGASDLIGQTEGTLFAVVDYRAVSFLKRVITLSATTNNLNLVDLVFLQNNTLLVRTRQNDVNVGQIITSTPFTSGLYKIAYTYKANEFRLIVNGVVASTITTGAVSFASTVERIAFGNSSNNDDFPFDRILLAGISKTALTQAEAIALTT
jgi:hypothetical protein